MNEEKRYVTLKDVAQKAHTSIATVSYVLNDSPNRYITPELRRRVLQAAEELHYVKSALASGLKGKPRGMISVVVPQFSNVFFSRIVLAVEQEAIVRGYILSICNTFDDAAREKEILNMLLSQRVDGFLLIPTENGFENSKALRSLNLPYVVIDRPFTEMDEYDFVTLDNYQAGSLAAQHLIDHGHRNIGYVHWDTTIKNLSERMRGVQETLRANGCPDAKVVKGGFSLEEGIRLTGELLTANSEITAVIYEQNIQAQGGVMYLNQAKIRIPDDVSVVVIGSPKWTRSNNPPIASIGMPEKEIGATAAKLLFDKIAQTEPGHEPVQKIFSCWINEGESVKNLLG